MTNQLPPLNAVRAFSVAARHQSFSLAAEELHVSHSAVSRHIKLLEEHLGVLLFERRVRQSVLTPAGQRFYEQVSAGLAQIANAAAALKQHASLPTVKINVRPSFAMLWLMPRLEDFIAQHPDIKPQVITQTQAPDHARDGFDLVIRRGRDDWAPAIEARALFEDELLLVAAPSLIQRAVAACCDIMPDLEAYDVNRNLLYNGLTEIGYECAKPQGAFYLFVKAPGGDAMAFAEKAKKKNLLIVPSDSFGVPGYFRLSYCVSKEMIERSLPAFKEVFAE